MTIKPDLYQLLFESAAEAILLMQNGRCVDCNESALTMFGCSKEAIKGQSLLAFSPPFQPDGQDSSEMLHQKLKAVAAGETPRFNWLHRRANGKPFYARMALKQVTIAGETYLQISSYDITEQIQQEELHRQNEALLLQRRGRQVRLSNQVSQAIASATSLDNLYHKIVTEVKEQFHYYHTQLFRYDTALNAVVLVAGYGEIGQAMLTDKHQSRLGSALVELATSGESVLCSTVADEPRWRPNPFLPDAEGELAVPIKQGERIWGVLDVYSDIAGLLDANDQLLLEGLCGQIAVTIESTRRRQEMEDRLRELESLQQIATQAGWQKQQQTIPVSGYAFHRGAIQPVDPAQITEPADAADLPAVVNPISVYGHAIGRLGVYEDPDNPLSDEEKSMLEAVSGQVAEALERARLLEQTKAQAMRAAGREQYQKCVADGTILLTQSGTNSLGTVLRDLGEVTGASRVYFCRTLDDGTGEYWEQIAQWGDPDVASLPDNAPYNRWPVSDTPFLALELQTHNRLAKLVEELPPAEARIFAGRGALSVVCLAVPGKHAAPGFIGFDDCAVKRIWQDDELSILQTLAIALSNTYALEDVMQQMQNSLAESEEQAQRLAQLSEMSQLLNQAKSEFEFFNIIAHYVPAIFQADRVDIATDIPELVATGDFSDFLVLTQAQGAEADLGGSLIPLKGTPAQRVMIEHNLDDDRMPGVKSLLTALFVADSRPIGSLTLGAYRKNAFTSRDENIALQIASLFSTAVENRRLFEQTQAALAEAEATQRRYTVQAWESYQRTRGVLSVQKSRSGLETPLEWQLPGGVEEALTKKQTVVVTGDGQSEGADSQGVVTCSSLIHPLTLRDQVVGVLGFQDSGERFWLPEEIALIEAVSTEFIQVAEELRLLDETQEKAAQEARINAIGEKIQATQSIEEALKVAIKEIGLSLHAPQATVKLEVAD